MEPNQLPAANPPQPPVPVASQPPVQQINYAAIVASAKKSSDLSILIITLIATVLLLFLLFEGTALEIFFTIVFALILSLVYVRLMQIRFMGNALRVQNGRHAYLLSIVDEISANLQMPIVDVYITQDPYLNAFAVGYTHPFTIVLHSAIVEELSPEELRAILVHEMGHIKYKHTIILAYVQPLTVLVPVLGPVIGWLFGFWGRRAELACDRLALAYTGNPHTVIMALIKIHVGSKFAEYMAEEGVVYQEKISKGITKLVSQSLENHPFLVTRVHELLDFSQKLGYGVPATVPLQAYQQSALQPTQPHQDYQHEATQSAMPQFDYHQAPTQPTVPQPDYQQTAAQPFMTQDYQHAAAQPALPQLDYPHVATQPTMPQPDYQQAATQSGVPGPVNHHELEHPAAMVPDYQQVPSQPAASPAEPIDNDQENVATHNQ